MMSAAYRRIISFVDPRVPLRLRPIWEDPAGPKTVHFWAPTFKWGLVIAGIADIARPAEKLSDFQSASLAATGTIWARYALVIIPKNWNLFSVNIFVGVVGYMQLFRIYSYKKPLAPPEYKFWDVIRYNVPATAVPESTESAKSSDSKETTDAH